jgi:hypothetical protein
MDSPAALQAEAYGRIKTRPNERTQRMLAGVTGFARCIGNEIANARRPNRRSPADTPVLYAAWFVVPPRRLADFDAWHHRDHVPILMQQKDWIAVRRFDIVDGEPEPFARPALHDRTDAAALDPPQRRRAHETPWRQRLAVEPWFNGRYKLFERHATRQKAVK